MKKKDEGLDAVQKIGCGGLASAIAKTSVAPFERIKLLLQTQRLVPGHQLYRGVHDAILRIPGEQGFFSLWRGNAMNVSRIVPTYALRFTLADKYRDIVSVGAPKDTQLSLLRQMAAAALSGFTTVLVTFPLDLMRTRVSSLVEANSGGRHSVGFLSTGRGIVSREGWRGLYRGATISAVEITPYVAITIGGYNYMNARLARDGKPVLWWSKLTIGWVLGLTGSLVCYPLDTLKRHLMLQGTKGFEGSVTASKTAASAAEAMPFSIAVVRHIATYAADMYRQGGIRVFYHGVLVNALKSAPAASLTFVLNDYFRGVVTSRS